MRKINFTIVLFLLALLCTGCLYSNVKIPYDTDLDRTKLGEKQGEATWQGVLWLFAWGDAGTEAAAANGGITTITHMDQKILNILFGLYTSQTTIVYGD